MNESTEYRPILTRPGREEKQIYPRREKGYFASAAEARAFGAKMAQKVYGSDCFVSVESRTVITSEWA